jgi:hypothetical protein
MSFSFLIKLVSHLPGSPVVKQATPQVRQLALPPWVVYFLYGWPYFGFADRLNVTDGEMD